MRIFIDKFKEVLASVLPISGLVILLTLTIAPIEFDLFVRFLLGVPLIIIGLTVFLVGVDRSVSPFGELTGGVLLRKGSVFLVICAGLFMGFLISIAEPDLHILADEVALATGEVIGKWTLVIIVSIGIAILVAIGLLRSLFNVPLYILMTILYGVILLLSIFSSQEFLAISFDSSGATTGAMTVPFILALALGIATKKKDSKASEKDSFGLVGVASAGAILAVLVTGLVLPKQELSGTIEIQTIRESNILIFLAMEFLDQFIESAKAIAPLFLMFLIAQPFIFRLKKRTFLRILSGFGFTLIGLSFLFTGVNAGFMDVGRELGSLFVRSDNLVMLVVIGFLLGFLTILAEPAVHILTEQIDTVTSGSVPRKAVFAALCIGVGTSVALSILRIILPDFKLWHVLLPGYLLAIALMYIGPKLFVGIAFDSGGVASGPMTATFILAYAQGAASALPTADVLIDGFGVIAMVALTPVITLQILGLLYRYKAKKKGGVPVARNVSH